MSRPDGATREIGSSFVRACGRRVVWTAYEHEDGRTLITVDGKLVDEEERLSDADAIARAGRMALEAMQEKSHPDNPRRRARW